TQSPRVLSQRSTRLGGRARRDGTGARGGGKLGGDGCPDEDYQQRQVEPQQDGEQAGDDAVDHVETLRVEGQEQYGPRRADPQGRHDGSRQGTEPGTAVARQVAEGQGQTDDRGDEAHEAQAEQRVEGCQRQVRPQPLPEAVCDLGHRRHRRAADYLYDDDEGHAPYEQEGDQALAPEAPPLAHLEDDLESVLQRHEEVAAGP